MAGGAFSRESAFLPGTKRHWLELVVVALRLPNKKRTAFLRPISFFFFPFVQRQESILSLLSVRFVSFFFLFLQAALQLLLLFFLLKGKKRYQAQFNQRHNSNHSSTTTTE
jgi:hypothetical protein